MIDPYYNNSGTTMYNNDCLDVIKEMPNNSIDTVLTDPPYALKFMGKAWDKILPVKEIWVEALRVAKPGAMMLVFGGDRTHHRLMVDIEDAGWEIRTCLYWLFGSGFPKSANISKQIDKITKRIDLFEPFAKHFKEQRTEKDLPHKDIAKHFPSKTGGLTGCVWNWENGANVPTVEQWKTLQPLLDLSDEFLPLIERIEAEREIIGKDKNWGEKGTIPLTGYKEFDITIPATPEAQLWDGWGSGLKPAVEIIVLAMKPLDGTFAENALKHGVAGLAIDKARIPTNGDVANTSKSHSTPQDGWDRPWRHNEEAKQRIYERKLEGNIKAQQQGRYPSNLLLSHSPECRQTGVKKVKSESGGDLGIRHQDAFLGTIPAKGELLKGRSYAKDDTETVPTYECVEGCAVKMLDEQAGELKSGAKHGIYNGWGHEREIYGDTKPYLQHCEASSGGPSRFYYCSKSSRTEREASLKGRIPCVKCGGLDTDYHLNEKGKKVKCVRNDHPTVKPLSIMEYLCKLTMTPTGGVILDMFGGTGTTALACEKIGRKCILIEKEKKSCDIAVARLKGLTKQGRLWDE